ncbi:MAG: alkaline phosphatase [Candidatus Hodarchaeales archaeon]|jgi:alkaline phosphatase
MEQLPVHGEVNTSSLDSTDISPTDSAATATAMATGNKTAKGRVATTTDGEPLPTILEYAVELEKSTGVITTTSIVHATPASFYAHEISRSNGLGIMKQLVEDADVDVIMGGGNALFTTEKRETMENRGYTILENRSMMIETDSKKVVGLYSSNHLPYEGIRDRSTTPSLSEMTEKSLEILSHDQDGFFLIMEGGQIDLASHPNDFLNSTLEVIEFDKAVEVAVNYAQTHSNTLLIVTADHETGGLALINDTLNSTLPSPTNSEEQNEQLRIARANNISHSWSSVGHTNVNVPFFGFGETINHYNDTILDNTDIFTIMRRFYESDQGAPDISIESPINNYIYNSTDIWLNITLNETATWLVYSINNQANVSMTKNHLLLSLSEGNQSIIVYAKDPLGNLGFSEVQFRIEIRVKSSTPGFVIFSLGGVLVILLKLNKRRRSENSD